MKIFSRKLWIALAVVLVVVVAAALALPALVDVNRYRGLIEQRAEQALGRDVGLGEMKLSLWPVFGLRVDDLRIGALPEEGQGDLLAADSLRVGARLFPLLRKRLEVTSLVLQAPRLRLERGPDGTWNVQRLLADEPAAPDAGGPGAGAAFRVESLRITDGRLTLRDAAGGRKQPLEVTLENLKLRLDGLSPDRPFEIALSAQVPGQPRAKLGFEGRAGPLAPAPERPTTLEGRLEATDLAPALLREMLAGVAPLPEGLVGPRAFSVAAAVDASFGAASRIALSEVRVAKPELNLRRGKDGKWNLPELATADRKTESTTEFRLDGLSLAGATVRVRDASGDGDPLELVLDRLEVGLDRLPGSEPARVELSASLASGGSTGALTVSGRLGPRDDPGGDYGAALAVRIDPIPGPLLRRALGEAVETGGRAPAAALELDVGGKLPGRPELKGSFRLGGARVALEAPDGTRRAMPLDLDARFDVAARNAGEMLDVRSLVLETGGDRLELRGTVRQEGALRRLDLELLPARLPADRLAALLALVTGDLPFSFASPTPVELRARVRGLSGEGRLPDLEGSAKLRDFAFRHALMDQPFERVGADVTLRGQRVEIASLTGRVGKSDVAGRVTVEGFERPRVGFELRSERADLGELFSFLRTDETATPDGAPPPAPPDLLLDGTIRIAGGTFETLDFENLEMRMGYSGGVVTLDPVALGLYGGTFRGRATADFNTAQPGFTVRGDAQQVDTDAFLTDNLGSAGLLTGRFSGRIETRGSGLDYESIVRGMKGEGAMEVSEGRVGKLDVLRTLSKVSGVFGETTLKRLSKQMATEGTAFRRLVSGLRVEGGKLAFDGMLLEAPDFQLGGRGTLDLITALLDGQFLLAFSTEISESMRAEGSRAAEVFYSSREQRVQLPFSLSGPFSAPTPGVDFKGVAKDLVQERARDRARDLIQERLGLKPAPPSTPPPATPPPATDLAPPEESPAPAPAPDAAPAETAGLVAEIKTARWGGSVLARDLKLEGRVAGTGLQRAGVVVTDARGIEIRRVDQLDEVKSHLASGADPAARADLSWRLTIDGKKLVVAKYPVTVRLEVTGADGRTAEAVRPVDR